MTEKKKAKKKTAKKKKAKQLPKVDHKTKDQLPYNKKYPQMMRDHLEEGNSYASFADKLGIPYQQMRVWESKYPAFLEVKKEAVSIMTGRPGLYKPEYCALLIKHMSQGLSYESFAGEIGVCIATLYNFEEKYPDWSRAKDKGRSASRNRLEKLGLQGMLGYRTVKDPKTKEITQVPYTTFNTTNYIFTMKTRHGVGVEESDSNKTEVTVNVNEAPIKTDEELEEMKYRDKRRARRLDKKKEKK